MSDFEITITRSPHLTQDEIDYRLAQIYEIILSIEVPEEADAADGEAFGDPTPSAANGTSTPQNAESNAGESIDQ